MSVAVACALASALLYALASVWQHRAAATASSADILRLGLLARLARNPLWLAGVAADIAAYIAQFAALTWGSLLLVQPLLVCGLLFALPLGAHLVHTRLTGRDWVAAIATCAGLAVFLGIVGSPRDTRHPGAGTWLVLLVAAAGAAGALVAGSGRRSPRARAALLSAAAGVVYGVAAALTRTAGHHLAHGGVVVLLSSWTTYGLVVAGVVGMVIAQSAFAAGPLDAALPPMTVIDPVASILIGVVAFGDPLPGGAAARGAEVLALLVMAAGVCSLARTKAVQALH